MAFRPKHKKSKPDPVQRTFQGFLRKKGPHSYSMWKTRFFVISMRSFALEYWEDQGSFTLLGSIPLLAMNRVIATQDCNFIIDTPTRIWYLCAENPHICCEWITELQCAIDKATHFPTSIAEDLLLLTIDYKENKGYVDRSNYPLLHLISGAVLLELFMIGHIGLEISHSRKGDRYVVCAVSEQHTPDDLLNDMKDAISQTPLTVAEWLTEFSGGHAFFNSFKLNNLITRILKRLECRSLVEVNAKLVASDRYCLTNPKVIRDQVFARIEHAMKIENVGHRHMYLAALYYTADPHLKLVPLPYGDPVIGEKIGEHFSVSVRPQLPLLVRELVDALIAINISGANLIKS